MLKKILPSLLLLSLPLSAQAPQKNPPNIPQPRPLRLQITPKRGGTDVSPATTLSLSFNRSVESLAVALLDTEGKLTPGTLQFIPKTRHALFDPWGDKPPYSADARLKPETKYLVVVFADGHSFASSFTTNNYGEPFPGNLKGDRFQLDLSHATIEEPQGLQMLVSGAGRGFHYPNVELSVLDLQAKEEEEKIQLEMSYDVPAPSEKNGEGGKTVRETTKLPPIPFHNPFFHLGPLDLGFAVMGKTITLRQTELSGTFSPDGKSVGEVQLKGVLDLREALKAAGDVAGNLDPAQVKGLLEGLLGQKLSPCQDAKAYCLHLSLANIQGALVP